MNRIAVLALFSFATVLSGKKPVTLEVAATPPPPMVVPVWAPDGRSFVYAERNLLWRYDVESKRRWQLGSLEPLERAAIKPAEGKPFRWENRRVTNEKIQWTPDGRGLVLYVGGDLFLWTLERGTWLQLTATEEGERNPKLSPDGRFVSFERDNELHVLELDKRKTTPLTSGSTATLWNGRLDWVYPEELDLGTAHWWSPDSAQIAFLQFDVSRQWIYPHANLTEIKPVYEPQRYPKAGTPNADVRLGVVNVNGGEVRRMSLGDPRDALIARVDWLPDSKRIAVQRLNRVQNELALFFADSSNGNAVEVLKERDPYWVNAGPDARFLKKREAFVWASEKDGYRHLYLHGYDGKQLTRLTEGSWDVKSVAAIDETQGVVYYHSRERGPLGIDVAAVGLDGSGRRIVTKDVGQHAALFSPTGEHFVDAYSSTDQPARLTLRRSSGSEVDVVQKPAEAASQYELVKPEIVTVRAEDGSVLYARLLKPPNFRASNKYPAIVMVYGGPHSQSVCQCWTGPNWDQALAQRGFVIWQLDNRGTAGRGHAWESKLYRRLGKQELADQELGIQHLISLGFVDPSRIGMYGWSYGGFMTLYTMMHAPQLIKAGVAGAPVVDWRNYDTIYTERYLGLPSENAEGYKLSSPVHDAAKLKGRLMLVHNFSDDNVLFQQSFQMMIALQNAGKMFETAIYPLRTHGLTGSSKKHFMETATDFFERHLK